MTDTSFETNMTRFEMGEAYKQITQTMGPCAQLIAFINFDKVTSESLGLESFNIVDLHQKVLADIDNGQYLEIAFESLSGRLDKLGTILSTVGGGLSFGIAGQVWSHRRLLKNAIYRENNPNDAFGLTKSGLIVGGISLAALAAGLVIKAVTHHQKVPSYREYKTFVDAFEHCLKADNSFANSIPSTFTLEAWEDFHNRYLGSDAEWDEHIESAMDAYAKHSGDKVMFSSSGWTANNFKDAVHWLVESQKRVDEAKKKYANRLRTIKTWVDHNKGNKDEDTRKVMKSINKIVGKSVESFSATHECLSVVKKKLDQVGHHFEAAS